MSLIQSAIAKAKAKALAEKMGATFEGAAETISATASGGGLVRIGSQLYDAATTQQDGVIAVKNVGRPGAALYAPATGSGATVTRTSSGGSGGSSAPTYHSQLLGLTTGDDHPQYLNNYRADARYVPLDRMVNAEAPIYTVDSDDGRLTEDVRLALRRATDSGLQVIGAQPGLAVGVSGLGLSVSAETVILTSSSNVSAGTSSILASNAGALTLIALSATSKITTPQIETSAGNLTLAPASGITSAGAQLHTTTLIRTPLIDTASGPLSLKAASNVVQMAATADLQTDHYVSQLTGWRITYPGAADFRYLYADELHAKSFIADLEQALAGGQIIAKSVAMVAESITVPPATGTEQERSATIRVRDLPSAPDVPVFASGDIVRLRKFTRADGSLTIADAWGAVTSYADGTGANQGTQTWTFTRSTAPNAGGMSAGTVIAPDALILDYGTSGNGIYEVSAIDGQAAQNSPYARVATWTGHPATGLTLRAQFGNLRGTYGYSAAEFGVAMGSPTAANITVDATNGIRLRHGTTDKITLSTTGDASFTGNITASSGSITGALTIGTNGGIYQGTGTLSSPTTGLRMWNDGGIGRIGGYNSGALQWSGDTSGKLTAGAGDVTLDASGIILRATAPSQSPTIRNTNTVSWIDAGGDETGFVEGYKYGTRILRIGATRDPNHSPYPEEGEVQIGVFNASRAMSPGIGMYSGATPQILMSATYIDLYGITRIYGNLIPNAGASFDVGSAGATIRKVYADEVIAATVTGTSLSGSIWQHDAADMYIRSSSASARTLYVANPGAGSMHLDVEGNITLGGTVDGVDIAAHAGNANAHHARSHAITSTSDHTASGLTAGQVLRASGTTTFAWAQLAHGDLSGIGTNTHAQIDSHISTADTHVAHGGVTITAGDGLTGGGTIAATRTLTLGTPGSSTATSANAVTSTSHTHAIDSTIARSAIDIAAGNGLTGGGNLTANRTLTLGTPSDLTASTTNAVTSTSHTHAISTAAAVGLSATTTSAAGSSASLARADHTHAIATGAASTLTVASTNTTGSGSNLARADHTHAITSSSNPGAAASILATNSSGYTQVVRLGAGMSPTRPLDVSGDAGITGQVSAGSGAFSGSVSITNGGNLTVGTVLQVNTAGTRIGINRAADSQFDLDVAGAIRGQYLIGKHAIQLSSAVGVWHFDGPQPYNLDFTGSNVSHTGVGGTESGGVIYRPGKFGKAVQVAEATTNLAYNPRFGSGNTNYWNFWQTGTGASFSVRTDGPLFGLYYARLTASTGSGAYSAANYPPVEVPAGQAITVTYWLRGNATSAQYILLDDTASAVVATWVGFSPNHADWRAYTLTWVNNTGTSRWVTGIFYVLDNDTSKYIDCGAVQVEQKAYATPYHDGSLTNPPSWNGTAHASTSSRTAASIAFTNIVPAGSWTVGWWQRFDTSAFSLGGFNGLFSINAYYGGANSVFGGMWINTGWHIIGQAHDASSRTFQPSGIGAAKLVPGQWYFVAISYDDAAKNCHMYFGYPNAASDQQFDSYTYSFGSGLNFSAGTLWINGGVSSICLDELIVLDYAADPKLIRAIYESDAPVFVESSVFHWRSPSRVPIWVDEFGLWARGVSGNEILGLYGGDPRNPTGNIKRDWGGIEMYENDIVIGRAAQAAVHWDDSAGTLLIGRPSASNMTFSANTFFGIQMKSGDTVLGSWGSLGLTIGQTANNTSRLFVDASGNFRIINRNGSGIDTTAISLLANGSASFAGAITASSGSITGALTMGENGKISLGNTSGNHLSISATAINLIAIENAGINGLSFRTGTGSSDETGYLKQYIATIGSKSAELEYYGAKFWCNAAVTLPAQSVTPANPESSAEANIYVKGNKLITQYNDGGTVRYKYLDLTGTGVTWVHTTTAP